MAGLSNSRCPFCSSLVENYIINFDCEIEMCENEKCAYPFTQSSVEGLIIENPNALKGYSTKKHNAPLTANTTSSSAASVACSAESVQNPRRGLSSTKFSDSQTKQKDTPHTNSTTEVVCNKRKRVKMRSKPEINTASLPFHLALPPASAAKTTNIINIPETPVNNTCLLKETDDNSNNNHDNDDDDDDDDDEGLDAIVNDIDSFLFHDIESPSDTVIATPKATPTSTVWLDDLQDIFKSSDVLDSTFDPLSL
ncbi:hypothetical protein BY458DRAFT_496178 [Sporodiniella umbellata]|nr:hypothetical protein BY458DRAFT_496178 [Sporodiniella umbellata]